MPKKCAHKTFSTLLLVLILLGFVTMQTSAQTAIDPTVPNQYRQYAYAVDGQIWIHDGAGDRLKGNGSDVTWAPDGNVLTWVNNREINGLNAKTGKLFTVPFTVQNNVPITVTEVAFSENGMTTVIATDIGLFSTIAFDDGFLTYTNTTQIDSSNMGQFDVRWIGNETLLYATKGMGQSTVWQYHIPSDHRTERRPTDDDGANLLNPEYLEGFGLIAERDAGIDSIISLESPPRVLAGGVFGAENPNCEHISGCAFIWTSGQTRSLQLMSASTISNTVVVQVSDLNTTVRKYTEVAIRPNQSDTVFAYAKDLNDGWGPSVFVSDRIGRVGVGKLYPDPTFTPNGQTLVFASENGNLGVYNQPNNLASQIIFEKSQQQGILAVSTTDLTTSSSQEVYWVESVAFDGSKIAVTLIYGNSPNLWIGSFSVDEDGMMNVTGLTQIDQAYQGQANVFFGQNGQVCFDALEDSPQPKWRAVYCLDETGNRVRVSPDVGLNYVNGAWDGTRFLMVESYNGAQIVDQSGVHILPHGDESTLPDCTEDGRCVYLQGNPSKWRPTLLADGSSLAPTGDYYGVALKPTSGTIKTQVYVFLPFIGGN